MLIGFTSTPTITAQSTQSATFVTFNYPLLGNTHIAANLNGDGRLDLAGSGANSAAVMLNNGNGSFQLSVQYPVAGQTQDVAAGDFNGAGRMDLAVTINTPRFFVAHQPAEHHRTEQPGWLRQSDDHFEVVIQKQQTQSSN
jgi:hypothetical protein